MTPVTIISNGVPRDILDGWEVSPTEREELDYVDWEAVDAGADSFSGFRYKGEIYDLGDIPARSPWVPTDEPDPFAGWHGVLPDSFFSGVLVRYCDESGRVIVGRYFA